jgi:hypothetical protein
MGETIMPTPMAVFEAPMAAPWPTERPAMVTIAVTAGSEMPPPIPMARAARKSAGKPESEGMTRSVSAIRAVPPTIRTVLSYRSASPPDHRWRSEVERDATEITRPVPAAEKP